MSWRPRAVLLDAGGTLFHLARTVGQIYAEVASRYGTTADAGQLQQRFQVVWGRRSASVPGTETIADRDQEKAWWREVVREVFAPEGGVRDFDLFFNELHELFVEPGLWRLYPEVQPILRRLREARLKLAIVSNWDSRLETLCQRLNIYDQFDVIVASATAGASKPDQKIFALALAKLDVRPADAMHVGDSWRDDVWGAFQHGLTPVWLKREGHQAPAPIIAEHTVRVASDLDEATGWVLS